MKPYRFTKNIRKRQSYCAYELKNCKYQDIYDFNTYSELEDNVHCELTLAVDKLGELEDIEEKLGIDLITLLKAQMNQFYFKKDKEIIRIITPLYLLNFDGEWYIEFHICGQMEQAKIKDYGKTWALSESELRI